MTPPFHFTQEKWESMFIQRFEYLFANVYVSFICKSQKLCSSISIYFLCSVFLIVDIVKEIYCIVIAFTSVVYWTNPILYFIIVYL